MPQATATAHAFAQQVLAFAIAQGPPAAPPGQAAVRACEQLRVTLTPFTGAAGFRSLLARALTLAQRETPWLAAVAVTEEGALAGLLEGAPAQEPAAAAAGGQALLTQFVGLLYTFVGEALTRRLLADAWPDAPVATPPPVRQETTP